MHPPALPYPLKKKSEITAQALSHYMVLKMREQLKKL